MLQSEYFFLGAGRSAFVLLAGALVFPTCVHAGATFFSVGDAKVVARAPVSREPLLGTKKDFRPYLEVEVRAQSPVPSPGCFVRAYFFNDAKRLIASLAAPQPREFDGVAASMPAFFPTEGRPLPCGFVLPEAVLRERDWRCVIVVGDAQETVAKVYPAGVIQDYIFPEKEAAMSAERAPVSRELKSLRLAEKVVFTGLPEYPKLTLFLKTPATVDAPREAKGVLALCLTAGSVDGVKRRLLLDEAHDDVYHLLRYAERRRLLVVCWGSHKVWDGARDWDQLDSAVAAQQARVFDRVSSAWVRGVKELGAEQGFDPRDMLLWGYSASAQYAKRLALRRPELFRAVYLHIPSSFDRPTPAGKSALWCLSTGERDYGYAGSAKFFGKCRELGYPMVYKVIPNLGHNDAAGCHRLARQFFDSVLSGKGVSEFSTPRYYGDWLNQTVVSADSAKWVPEALRVPLPDERWAAVWAMTGVDSYEEEERTIAAAKADEKKKAEESVRRLRLDSEALAASIDRLKVAEAELLRERDKARHPQLKQETLKAAEESLARLFRANGMTTTYGASTATDSQEPKSAAMLQAEATVRALMRESTSPAPSDRAADDGNTPFGRRAPKPVGSN